MMWLTADIMHISKLSGIAFDSVLARARVKFDEEEGQIPLPAGESGPPLPADTESDEMVTVYATDDLYDAEIVRGLFRNASNAGSIARRRVVSPNW